MTPEAGAGRRGARSRRVDRLSAGARRRPPPRKRTPGPP